MFTSRKKISTSVLLSGYVLSIQMICFSIKLETEWFDTFSRMLFVRVLCEEYHVIADESIRKCWFS